MAFLRSVATTASVAACLLPAAISLSASSSSSSQSFRYPKPQHLFFLSSSSLNQNPLFLSSSLTNSTSNLHMDAPTSDHKPSSQGDDVLPELLTEYMVDMKCEGCVKNKLQVVEGVKSVEVDLDTQVVRILGATPLKIMTEALEQTGRKARLIGQGIPDDFLVSAAVAEFKGPDVFGVVRFGLVNMELARIEGNFTGLSPGKHGWSINEFGDLTEGAASTGKVFNPSTEG